MSKFETGAGVEILLHEIFSSVQGEGSMAGTPMTFIRLWGCNMKPRCPFCDTPQTTDDHRPTTVRALTAAAYALGNKWVCITGGEPTIHRNLSILIETLQSADLKVAIETNGTNPFPPALYSPPDWICVSPKPGYLCAVLERADEIKVLVGADSDLDVYSAGGFIEAYPAFVSKICLQPVWSRYRHVTDENVRWALRLCHKYQVRLSLQLHRYIGVK